MIQWYNVSGLVLEMKTVWSNTLQHVPTTMYILCYKPSQLPQILFSQAHCNQTISDSFLYPNAPNNYLKQLCLIWIIPFVLDNLIPMYLNISTDRLNRSLGAFLLENKNSITRECRQDVELVEWAYQWLWHLNIFSIEIGTNDMESARTEENCNFLCFNTLCWKADLPTHISHWPWRKHLPSEKRHCILYAYH